MNLRQTAEVSAIIATSASHIIENSEPVPTESLHGYWKQSRMRLKCWFAALRAGRTSAESSKTTQSQQSQTISLSREILVTEMLTRVWSTVLTATDRRQGVSHAAATASNIFQGHLEARNEVLRLIADDGALPADQQLSLERFRRRIERWTDALLGPLLANYGVDDYAFDPERAGDFAASSWQQSLSNASTTYLPLLIAGVSAAFPRESDADRERLLLNRAIVRSILAAYPTDAFPRGGQIPPGVPVPSSAAHQRLESSPSSQPKQNSPPQHSEPKLSFTEIRRREQRDRSSSD